MAALVSAGAHTHAPKPSSPPPGRTGANGVHDDNHRSSTYHPAEGISDAPSFLQILSQELTPYPGRVSLVIRIVLSTVLAVWIFEGAHLPMAAIGAYYALLTTRQSLRDTVTQVGGMICLFCLATVYIVLGVALFGDSPVTHFLWVVGTLYLLFIILEISNNFAFAAAFSILVALSIPSYDATGSMNAKIALTLYTLWAATIGTSCVLLVEVVYRYFFKDRPVVEGVADRLHVVADLLESAADVRPPPKSEKARLMQYALVGSSSLRQLVARSRWPGAVRARLSAVIAVSDRLIELCTPSLGNPHAGLWPASNEERAQIHKLSHVIAKQAASIRALTHVANIGQLPGSQWNAPPSRSKASDFVRNLEDDISLLSGVLHSFGIRDGQQPPETSTTKPRPRAAASARTLIRTIRSKLFQPDAFTNKSYLVLALRGWLAATLCFILYNGVAWPGISTAVVTCLITAESTIGSSRQKQLLRISGAAVGGFVIAIPGQMYLLPHLNSIASFTVFLASVTALAAWFNTCSPRISYFGKQIALAFYLVNLQEPYQQLSLSLGRDRVMGVLLGLSAMWLIFDRIAAPLASVRMNVLLRTNLILLGDLAHTLASAESRKSENVSQRSVQLLDKINATFSEVNAQADALPFEFGPRRKQHLRERSRMRAMQPAMHSIFLLEISLAARDYLAHNALDQKTLNRLAMLRKFLRRSRTALSTIADLPVFGEGSSLDHAVSNSRETKAAVTGVHAAFDLLAAELAGKQGATLALCREFANSLTRLERVATDWSMQSGLPKQPHKKERAGFY